VAKPSIFNDPRYDDFVARYAYDPLAFAVEVCGMTPSEDQAELFDAIAEPTARVSVVSGTGCFAAGTQMMRANGEAVNVENIVPGDQLMGPDGDSVRNVEELKRGREPMYRFTYTDGTSHVFNESHILCLAAGAKYTSRGSAPYINVTVREWLKWPKTRQLCHYAYRSPVKQFERPAEPLPMPPYILGVWLGDGNSQKPEICNPDDEVVDAWVGYVRSMSCTVKTALNSRSADGKGCWVVSACRVLGTEQANPVTAVLRSIGVFDNKHIPDAYLYASLEDRRQLVAGLIDTDGHFDKSSGGYDWIQKDERLARQFAWLVRSIGCSATIKPCRKGCQTGAVGDYWRVTIGRNVRSIPVRIPRKIKPATAPSPSDREKLEFGIKSVEPLGEGDYFGFTLDEDSRFLGHDFTVLHNTGKTSAFGRIALWHLLCYPVAIYDGKVEIGSNTYIGAPAVQQVADGVWKEMTDTRIAIGNGEFSWLLQYFDITKTRVAVKGYEAQWFISQVAMAKGQAVAIAGKHRFFQLIIIDEAAGVPDEHFNVIDGTQTQAGNRTLMASQGARNAGRFFESHHTLNIDNGGQWTGLRFSSEESPFVTDEWLEARKFEAGGRDSIEYKIRCRGLFAENTSNTLLSRGDMDRMFKPNKADHIIRDDEPFGLVLLGDVGMGEYRDDSVAVLARIIGDGDGTRTDGSTDPDARRVEYMGFPICSNSIDEIQMAGDLANLVGKLSNCTLYVDAGGIGHAVCKLIELSGGVVERVNWGQPCFKKANKERYYNLRACAMVRFRDAVRQGRAIITAALDKVIKEKIVTQGSRLPYHFTEAGGLRYVMMAKDKMLEEGFKSPDMIDAMSFAFLEGCHYVPSHKGDTPNGVAKANVIDAMAAEIEAQLAGL
jgi:hypothetical protein